MKDYDKVYELIRNSHTIYAQPRLVAEFNHNRYSNPVASNTPLADDGQEDPDLFDIDSIVGGLRPAAGIIKARVGEWYVGEDYEIAPDGIRYYVSDPDDVYKYWTGPVPTTGTTFPSGTAGYTTDVNPQVIYPSAVTTNKIVIGLENSFSSPVDYDIYVKTTPGASWTLLKNSVSDNLQIDADGRVILYYNGSSWTQSRTISQHTTLAGVQLRVRTMSKSNTFFNLIEMGLRLEWNMTSLLKSVGDTFDLGDTSTLNPIGEANSNVASVELFNHYENGGYTFSEDNPNSLFKGLMEENVKFTLDYVYDLSSVGGTVGYVRQFEMYADAHWSAQSTESTTVSLRDASKFLQEVKAVSVFYENRTITGIICRLLDSVGFDSYDVGKLGMQKVNGVWTQIEIDTNPAVIPYFWATSDQTVWEVIQDLASGTQTAVYFDEWGRLQVLTRQQAFSNAQGSTWTLRGAIEGPELTDIQEYEMESLDVSNDVTVNYQTTEFEEYVSGVRRNSIVWQPEDETVYVKSSDIQADCLVASGFIKLTPADAALWPFESYMMLDAEMIHYKGKQFTYYPSESNNPSTVAASATVVILETYDDYKKYHFDKTPIKNRYLNKFSGNLKIAERGMWNTPVQDHKIETLSQWDQKNVKRGTASRDLNGFYKDKRRLATYKKRYSTARKKYLKNKKSAKAKRAYKVASAQYKAFSSLYKKYRNAAVTDGIVVPTEKASINIKTTASYGLDHYLMAMRGNANQDLGFKYYGTRLKLNKHSTLVSNRAGISIMSTGGSDAASYKVEISPRDGTGGAGTVKLYRTDSSGAVKWVVQKNAVILTDKWYSLDVRVEGSDSSSSYIFSVYLDGNLIMVATASGSNKTAYTGRFGMYSRAKTSANFEYFYAVGSSTSAAWPDNFAKYDRINKGFASARFSDFVSDKVEKTVKRKVKKKLRSVKLNYKHLFFDEFGPIAHEIREFDVKYDSDNKPVLAPYVYWTNTGMADTYEVSSDSYSSKVYMINTARDDAALQGTDDNHQFCVYGMVLKQRDVQQVKAQNKSSIAAIGTKELTVESKWVQNKETAQGLADWITAHWARATDSLTVTIFGNPLIEVGDIVTADIPEANMDVQTHKYFVMGADSTFAEGGLTTTLKLRRIRN